MIPLMQKIRKRKGQLPGNENIFALFSVFYCEWESTASEPQISMHLFIYSFSNSGVMCVRAGTFMKKKRPFSLRLLEELN